MAIPVEAVGDVVGDHGVVVRDDVLDGADENVVVVREVGGKGRAIVEDVLGLVFGQR